MQALEELVELIMLDDFVQRRKALDTWTSRWIATAHVEHPVPPALAGLASEEAAKTALTFKMVQGMMEGGGNSPIMYGVTEKGGTKTRHVLANFIRSVPYAG